MDTAGKMMSERLSTCEAILSKRGTYFRLTMIWSWWCFQKWFKAQLGWTMIRSWYDKASNEKSLRRNSPLPQLLSIPSFCAEWSGSSVTLETTYIQKQHGCFKITPSFDLFLCACVIVCLCVSGSLFVMTHSVVTAVGSQLVSLQSNKTCTYWSQQHQN